jgi:HPt (histidine-containing phosphotransfer) domain-containing protein
MAEPVAVDISSLVALRQLQAPGKPDRVGRIVDRFLEETPERLAALRAATANGNPGALEAAAHALKGIAGTVGANEMRDLAAGLEHLGRGGSTLGASEVIIALEASLDRARAVFEPLRTTATPDTV